MWVGTQKRGGLLKSDRFVPIASVPYGIVYSFADGQCREYLDEPSGRAFPFDPGACGRAHSLGQARAPDNRLVLCCMML